ncbi:hypothetical protein [Corynebacterium sp. A21]|uniref:hypothetical protein n=1 Tax=Corynebacterium sp. A21 TaxID=3457318 RepID=UPI003FD44EC3
MKILHRWAWISVWVSLAVGVSLAIGGLNGFYVTLRMLQFEDANVSAPLHRIETAWGYMWPGVWFLAYGAILGIGMKVLPKTF